MRKAVLMVRESPSTPSTPYQIDYRVDKKRRREFFATKSAAEAALSRIKSKLSKEGAEALSLSDTTRVAALHGERALAAHGKTINDAIQFYLAHLAKLNRSIPISQLVTEVLAEKKELGFSEIYLKDLRLRFGTFCADFGTEGTRTLSAQQVREWLYGLKLSHVSINNFRSRLSTLFAFGVERGYMDKNLIEEIAKKKVVDAPPEIFSVDELSRLLATASTGHPEMLPIFALGAFSGVRTAELLRLRWEDLDLQRGFVNVPASKSKTARRRNIKMEPCLQAWLSPYAGSTGAIYKGNIHSFYPEIVQTSEEASVVWAPNGLRNSYCSYSLAKYQNAAKLAIDMGHTTTKLIFAVYRELVSPEEAERYFNIFPPAPAENIVPMDAAA
jgi:integrase